MENKTNKGLVWLVAILIVLVVALLGFIVYREFYSDVEVINKSEEKTNIIESKNPSAMQGYNLYYNYEKIYRHYFKMDEEEKLVNNIENYAYIKIENNKLMWNIDNVWTFDDTIKDDIHYFDITSNIESSSNIIVLTSNNELYYIDITNFEGLYGDGYDYKTLKTITSNEYEKMEYQKIEKNIEIDKIVPKMFCDCECWNQYYLETKDNEIYILQEYSDEKIVSLEKFMEDKENNIINLEGQCSDIFTQVKIDFNGYSNNVLNANGDKIKVKYYIVSYNRDSEEINNLIIDFDDNLYYFADHDVKDSLKIKSYSKVRNFSYNADKWQINIELLNGEELSLTSNIA